MKIRKSKLKSKNKTRRYKRKSSYPKKRIKTKKKRSKKKRTRKYLQRGGNPFTDDALMELSKSKNHHLSFFKFGDIKNIKQIKSIVSKSSTSNLEKKRIIDTYIKNILNQPSINLHRQFDDVPFYYALPYELTGAHLQYLIDNQKIKIFDNKFLQIQEDFPSLTLDKSDVAKKTGFEDSEFVEVEELENLAIPFLDGNRFTVNVKCNNIQTKLIQDVSYILKSIEQVHKILKNEEIQGEEICDYTEREKLIINTDITIGDKKVVIIGSPDPKRMNLYLKEENYKDILDNELKNSLNYTKEIVKLYNHLKGTTYDSIDEIFLKALNKDILQFDFLYNSLDNVTYDKNSLLTSIKDKIKFFSNNLLNLPLIKITYIFHIFVESDEQDKYKPLILSIRDIKPEHTVILKKVLQLIQTDIPSIFELDKTKANFYSYYQYGEFFHIKTDYIHPMVDYYDYQYRFNISITLEELIYQSQLKDDNTKELFLKKIPLKYYVRNWRLEQLEEPAPGGPPTPLAQEPEPEPEPIPKQVQTAKPFREPHGQQQKFVGIKGIKGIIGQEKKSPPSKSLQIPLKFNFLLNHKIIFFHISNSKNIKIISKDLKSNYYYYELIPSLNDVKTTDEIKESFKNFDTFNKIYNCYKTSTVFGYVKGGDSPIYKIIKGGKIKSNMENLTPALKKSINIITFSRTPSIKYTYDNIKSLYKGAKIFEIFENPYNYIPILIINIYYRILNNNIQDIKDTKDYFTDDTYNCNIKYCNKTAINKVTNYNDQYYVVNIEDYEFPKTVLWILPFTKEDILKNIISTNFQTQDVLKLVKIMQSYFKDNCPYLGTCFDLNKNFHLDLLIDIYNNPDNKYGNYNNQTHEIICHSIVSFKFNCFHFLLLHLL